MHLPSLLSKFGPVCGALLLSGAAAFGAASASDNASDPAYNSGWTTGTNGGFGFNAWTLTNGANSGFFIGDSTVNAGGASGNINSTGNKSWGEFANSGGVASAVRTFTAGGTNGAATLDLGQQFIMKLDNGFVDAGGTVGFGLQDSSGVNRLEFFFVGNSSSYTVSDAAPQATTHGFTGDGLTAVFTLTTADTYALAISYNTGTPPVETFTGTLKGTVGAGIDRVRVFNANAGSGSSKDAFANSMQIVPEPGAFALLSLASLGTLVLRRRR